MPLQNFGHFLAILLVFFFFFFDIFLLSFPLIFVAREGLLLALGIW